MKHTRTEFAGWHKSRRSGSGENCVFQGVKADSTGAVTAVGVYDSKQDAVSGDVLAFTPEAWKAFVGNVAV